MSFTKSHSFKCLWPGLGHILILEPMRAPRGWNVGLARHGVSPLEPFGLEAGEMSSQRKTEVLDVAMRTDSGSGKAADSTPLMAHCRATESEAHRSKRSLRVRGCSHLLSFLAVLPQRQEALPLTEKAALLLVVISKFLP